MSKKCQRLRVLAERAEKYYMKMDSALGEIASIISEISGEEIHCSYFPDDGIGVSVGDSSDHTDIEGIINELKETGEISPETLNNTYF